MGSHFSLEFQAGIKDIVLAFQNIGFDIQIDFCWWISPTGVSVFKSTNVFR